ncbi:ferritin-like protein [Micromonospora sp. NBC_01699]|uniref:ferritin-like domain-containing protein n=1 Tax=Micromonospora sp. NBC_01699 TaxID=2975984 RepID=UPI002E2FFBE8|nr:ferritin-like domain-containing protein [Micromonospora sp. NBC_01699]
MATTEPALLDKPTTINMLHDACELEHMLCVQYLYAAATLSHGGDPGVTTVRAALTEQWSQQLSRIAVQEMYHLTLANNILIALGAAPYLWRPNFPQPASRYSDINLPSTLTPFSQETVSRFLCWEKPEPDGWWDDFCAECGRQAHTRLNLAMTASEERPYGSIAELYDQIKAAILGHPEWIDPASAARQVTSALIPLTPTLTPITTAEQAARYIDIIVLEGEGAPDWQSDSHFAYFHQIADQLDGLKQTQPDFAPGWPTVENPVYDPANTGGTLITDPAVRAVGVTFNELYLLFVEMLVRLFTPDGQSTGQRQGLARVVTALMPLGIKPLAALLTRLPAGAEHPGRYAGPAFELPQPQPTGPPATVDELAGRLLALAGRCRVLGLTDSGLDAGTQDALATIAARLETLVPLFTPSTVELPA